MATGNSRTDGGDYRLPHGGTLTPTNKQAAGASRRHSGVEEDAQTGVDHQGLVRGHQRSLDNGCRRRPPSIPYQEKARAPGQTDAQPAMKEDKMKKPDPEFAALQFTEKNPDEMIALSESFYRNVQRRRSVRDFSDRPVPEEVIKNALLAAGTAPSRANMQPWHFVVVGNPDTKRAIREAAEEEERAFYQGGAPEEWLNAVQPLGTDANKPFLETAPSLIVVFLKKVTLDKGGKGHKNYYTTESVGIAVGILITALHLSGLATLTHTPSPMRFLNRILGRPDSERPFLILVTGYPGTNATVPAISRYELDQIASFF